MFFGKKPKAVVQVSRLTAPEENVIVTVNANKLDRDDIYKAITEAAEAMRLRLIDNNKIALSIADKDISDLDTSKVQDIIGRKKGK